MKLLVWDLVIGMQVAIIDSESVDGKPEQVRVAVSDIDVKGGNDSDYRNYEFPEGFLETDELYPSEAQVLRELQETTASQREPFACIVTDRDEALSVLRIALHARGGADMNCDGMEVSAFRCVQELLQSLDGDLNHLTYSLNLFVDPAPASITVADANLVEAASLPPGTVGCSLSDW